MCMLECFLFFSARLTLLSLLCTSDTHLHPVGICWSGLGSRSGHRSPPWWCQPQDWKYHWPPSRFPQHRPHLHTSRLASQHVTASTVLLSQYHASQTSFVSQFHCCISVALRPSNLQVYRRGRTAQTIVCAATLREKLKIKLSISSHHSIVTPGQPVALTLKHQAPGKVATGVPILSHWYDLT